MPHNSQTTRSKQSNKSCIASCRDAMAIALDDLKKPHFWRAVAGEFIGTMLLVIVGIGACFKWSKHHDPTPTHIALLTGLYIAFIIMALGHISGGLVNPALSISFAVANRISFIRMVFYVLAECLGSVVGTAVLLVLAPESIHGELGVLKLNKLVTEAQGFGIEFIITFLLLFGIFAVTDERRKDVGGSKPLTIGLIVTINIYFGMNFTGGGMNPARQFGPSLITGKWEHHWIYWIGPICGGVCGTLLYEYVFAVKASFKKTKRCITRSGSYDSVAVEVKPTMNGDLDSDDEFGALDEKKKLSIELLSSI